MRGYQTQDQSRGEALESLTKEFAELLEDSRALKRELAIARALADEHRRAVREANMALTRIPELERECAARLAALNDIERQLTGALPNGVSVVRALEMVRAAIAKAEE